MFSVGVSGGHLNPAVTLGLATVGRISWRKVPHYLLAQYTGALLGAGLVLALYWEGLVWYEHQQGLYRTVPGTATIFTSFPSSPHLSWLAGAGDQLVSTAILVLVFCRLSQPATPDSSLALPAGVAVTVLGLGTSLGLNCGAPLNPARDLAPRILCGEGQFYTPVEGSDS